MAERIPPARRAHAAPVSSPPSHALPIRNHPAVHPKSRQCAAAAAAAAVTPDTLTERVANLTQRPAPPPCRPLNASSSRPSASPGERHLEIDTGLLEIAHSFRPPSPPPSRTEKQGSSGQQLAHPLPLRHFRFRSRKCIILEVSPCGCFFFWIQCLCAHIEMEEYESFVAY